jgi:hypothetical protein
MQPDIDHLSQEQSPSHPAGNCRSHRLGRENYQFAEIDKKRENNRANAGQEAGNHVISIRRQGAQCARRIRH